VEGPDHDLLHKLQVEVVVGDKVRFAENNIATPERILDQGHGLYSLSDVGASCIEIVLESPAALVAAGALIDLRRHLHSWAD